MRPSAAGAPAPAGSSDDICMLLEAKRRREEETVAMKKRVATEMTAAMDTGVRVNPALAAAYGINIEQRLRGDDSDESADAEAGLTATMPTAAAAAATDALPPCRRRGSPAGKARRCV